MRVPASEKRSLRASTPDRFLMVSIHHLKAEGVNDRFVLFAWEYSQEEQEALPVTPVLRRRELESARKFCRDQGLIPLPTSEKDPLNTLEYWVQADARSIIESWT